MHDRMQYDPIQGQGHEPLKVGNSAIFKRYLLPHFNGDGKWPLIRKLGPEFCYLPCFCVT